MSALKIIFMCLIISLLQSCSGVQTIDSRPLILPSENLKKVGYALPSRPQPETVYIKEKQISINEVDQKNRTGSLFNLNDDKNDLYGNLDPDGIGRFIDVAIMIPGLKDKKGAPVKEDEKGKRTPEEEELIKQFPYLVPLEDDLHIQRFFKMQIMQRFPNGDVLAFYKRSSDGFQTNRDLSVSARIRYSDLVKTTGVTTDDLSDIHFNEVSASDTLDRRSSNWEDEYSLRISRFRESRSREASELAQKRKDLNEFRGRMLDRLKSFGQERIRTAKERDQLLEDKKNNAATIDKLKTKIDDLDKQLADAQKAAAANKPKAGAAAAPAGQTPPGQKATAPVAPGPKP